MQFFQKSNLQLFGKYGYSEYLRYQKMRSNQTVFKNYTKKEKISVYSLQKVKKCKKKNGKLLKKKLFYAMLRISYLGRERRGFCSGVLASLFGNLGE